MNNREHDTGNSRSGDGESLIKRWQTNLSEKISLLTISPALPFILFGFLMLVLYLVMGRDVNHVIASLDKVSVVIGTFTTILAGTTWFSLQRLRNNIRITPPSAGNDAAILIIDIEMTIRQNVLNYCTGKDTFSQVLDGTGFLKPDLFELINKDSKGMGGFIVGPVSPGQRVVYVHRPEKIEPSELASLGSMIYSAFGAVDKALHENGIGSLYVFYGGMTPIPFFLGELFGNRYDIHIYHYQGTSSQKNVQPSGQTYHYCGRMNHLLYK